MDSAAVRVIAAPVRDRVAVPVDVTGDVRAIEADAVAVHVPLTLTLHNGQPSRGVRF